SLARGFARGARSGGVDVWSIGIVPTPVTYFAANTLPVDGLCMITGSHNPPEYNGFKVGIGKSTLAGPEVQELKERVVSPRDNPVSRHGLESEFDVVTPYLHFVTQALGTARRLKVVVDAGNGTAGAVAPRLLRALGHELLPPHPGATIVSEVKCSQTM